MSFTLTGSAFSARTLIRWGKENPKVAISGSFFQLHLPPLPYELRNCHVKKDGNTGRTTETRMKGF